MVDRNSDIDSLGKNQYATLLEVIAWMTYLGGFIAGISLANVEVPYILGTRTQFSIVLALAYWAAAFVSGSVFLGFAEIIKLLQQLVDKEKTKEYETMIEKEENQFSDLPEL